MTLKDPPFDEPVLARYASDGTMKLLAYLDFSSTIPIRLHLLGSKNRKISCILDYCQNSQRMCNRG